MITNMCEYRRVTGWYVHPLPKKPPACLDELLTHIDEPCVFGDCLSGDEVCESKQEAIYKARQSLFEMANIATKDLEEMNDPDLIVNCSPEFIDRERALAGRNLRVAQAGIYVCDLALSDSRGSSSR